MRPYLSKFTTGLVAWEAARRIKPSIAEALNVYVDINGTICKTPFEMPRSGLWWFDGQVFYQKKGET